MAIQDHILNLKKIHNKMKKKPKLYRLYNFFMGVPDMLELEQLTEFRKIAFDENEKLIKDLDKKIAQLTKKTSKQTA